MDAPAASAAAAELSFTRTWRAFAHEFGVDVGEVESFDELLARLRDGAFLEQAAFDVYRLQRQRDFVPGGATVGFGDDVRATRWDK